MSSTREQAQPAERERTDRQPADTRQPGRPPRSEAWPPPERRRAGPRRFDDLF